MNFSADIQFSIESLSLKRLIFGLLLEFLEDTRLSKIPKIEKEIEKRYHKTPFASPSNLIFPAKQANRKSIKQQTNSSKKKNVEFILAIFNITKKFKKN
jgi:hypothetical protein